MTITSKMIVQTDLCLMSGVAVFLMAGKHHKKAFVLSLITQPLWFYATYSAEQWGMFILTFWHTGNQIRGYLNHREE